MKKGNIRFFVGLIMFMFGIYISTYYVIGILIGIAGGIVMGSSTFNTKKLISLTNTCIR